MLIFSASFRIWNLKKTVLGRTNVVYLRLCHTCCKWISLDLVTESRKNLSYRWHHLRTAPVSAVSSKCDLESCVRPRDIVVRGSSSRGKNVSELWHGRTILWTMKVGSADTFGRWSLCLIHQVDLQTLSCPSTDRHSESAFSDSHR